MAAAQLSLFAESQSAADISAAGSLARKRRGRSAATAPSAPAAPTTPDLFTLSPIYIPAEAPLAALPPAADRAAADRDDSPWLDPPKFEEAAQDPLDDDADDPTLDDDDEAADDDGRVRFDPTVWHLRSESGDFIHIQTGEIRAEDDFRFTAAISSPFDDRVSLLDDWDVAQDSEEAGERVDPPDHTAS